MCSMKAYMLYDQMCITVGSAFHHGAFHGIVRQRHGALRIPSPLAYQTLFETMNVAQSECFNPVDKDMILETVRQHHGSTDAFDTKLRLQVRFSVYRVRAGDGISP